MQYITVPLPDRISPTDAARLVQDVERAINRRTGALVEATVTDLAPLTDQERRVLCAAIDLAITATVAFNPYPTDAANTAAGLIDLRAQLDPGGRPAIIAETIAELDPAEPFEDLTRPQELAADAMASEYGRCRVRKIGDGAVEITGMTDDVERARVVVEPDGRERMRGTWRR